MNDQEKQSNNINIPEHKQRFADLYFEDVRIMCGHCGTTSTGVRWALFVEIKTDRLRMLCAPCVELGKQQGQLGIIKRGKE